MLQPADVVTVEFPGAMGIKRRPAIVVSSPLYHHSRPDVILGLLTSQTDRATLATDHNLQDWLPAGLFKPSVFRAFLATLPLNSVTVVGHLSDRDWQAVQRCVQAALALG